MARDFVGNVDTVEPTQVPGTSIGVVNPLEGLDDAVNAGAEVLGGIALSGLDDELNSAGGQDAFLYERSRDLKNKMLEAGKQGNQEAMNRYTVELERLKIAERQGLIGPAAIETRRATIAKDYITRFPHLAADIKKVYSATGGGASAGSGKEQFKDPVEEAQDKIIAEYQQVAGIMPFNEFYRIKSSELRKKVIDDEIDLRTKLGQAAESDLEDLALWYQQQAGLRMQATRRAAIAMSKSHGSFNAAEITAADNAVREDMVLQFQQDLQERVNAMSRQQSGGQRAIVSQNYIKEKVAEIRKIFDDGAADVKSLDELEVLTRFNQSLKERGIINLRAIDDTTGFLLTISPESAVKVIDEVKGAFDANAIGMLDRKSVAATNPLTRSAIEAVRKNPNLTAQAFLNAVIRGNFDDLEVADPVARAAVTSSIRDTVIGNPAIPPERQHNAAIAAMAEESKALGRDTPIPAWYERPHLAKILAEDKELARIVTQNVTTAGLNVVMSLADTGLTGKITYNPKPDLHGAKPWEFYPNGGPFEAPPITGAYVIGNVAGVSAQADARSKSLKRLNEGWATVRAAHGEAEADKWARDMMQKIDKKTRDLEPAKPATPDVPEDTTGLSPEEIAWANSVGN